MYTSSFEQKVLIMVHLQNKILSYRDYAMTVQTLIQTLITEGNRNSILAANSGHYWVSQNLY